MDVSNAVNKALRDAGAPSNLNIVINQKSQRGNIVLETDEGHSAKDLEPYKVQINRAVAPFTTATSEVRVQTTWYKAMIHAIDYTRFPDTPTGMNLLKEEIETYNDGVILLDSPRYTLHPDKRGDKTCGSAVIALATEAKVKEIARRGIIVAGERKKAKEYHSARPTDQCTNCLGFGHAWQRCSASAKCNLCGLSHATRDHTCPQCPSKRGKPCTHYNTACANCDGPHKASDPQCPTLTALKDARRPEVLVPNTQNTQQSQHEPEPMNTDDNHPDNEL